MKRPSARYLWIRPTTPPVGRLLDYFLPLLAAKSASARFVNERLEAMQFYDLDSTVLRELDDQPSRQPILGSRGEHLGPVLGYLEDADAIGKERFNAYISSLVPGARTVDERLEGRYSTVQARFAGEHGDEMFLRESLSEGTLRAAGILSALLQPQVFAGRVPLVLLQRMLAEMAPGLWIDVPRPYRVPRDSLIAPHGLERILAAAAQQGGPHTGVLVLIDADDDCPAKLGPSLLARAATVRPVSPVSVVLANREFEAWFLAAAS